MDLLYWGLLLACVLLWLVIGIVAGFIALSASYYENGLAAALDMTWPLFIVVMILATVLGPIALWFTFRDFKKQKFARPRIAKYGLIYTPGQGVAKLRRIRAERALTT